MEEIKNNLLALWNGLSTQRKISVVASLILSLVVLGGVVYLASKPQFTLLYGSLSSAEAGKVIEYLDSKKIAYEVSDGGKTILVPAQQVYSARLGLASEGVPAMSDGGTGMGFELFDRPTFGMSDFMQRANYYRALEGELERTIRQLDEVSNARVLIVVPESHLFGQDHQEAKASVFLQLQPGRSLNESQVRAIQFLVANGVEALQPDHVAVVDSYGHALAESDTSGPGDQQTTEKRRQANINLDNYLQEKAQSMLDQVLGPGQAVVRVSSELDYTQVQETSEKYDPKNEAIHTETTSTESSTTQSPGGGSTGVGVSANSSTTDTGSNGKTNEEKKDNTTDEYQVGKVVENRIEGGGTIKRLTIALMLNQMHGPDGKPILRTAEEKQALENIVKAAVGFTQDTTQPGGRQDVIDTQEIAFADIFSNTTAATPNKTAEQEINQEINRWLPYVTQGCLILVALGLLLYFRSIFSSAPSAQTEPADSFELLLRNYQAQTNGNGNGSTATPRAAAPIGGILTPDELSRLIRENPSNTSQALKQWLKRN